MSLFLGGAAAILYIFIVAILFIAKALLAVYAMMLVLILVALFIPAWWGFAKSWLIKIVSIMFIPTVMALVTGMSMYLINDINSVIERPEHVLSGKCVIISDYSAGFSQEELDLMQKTPTDIIEQMDQCKIASRSIKYEMSDAGQRTTQTDSQKNIAALIKANKSFLSKLEDKLSSIIVAIYTGGDFLVLMIVIIVAIFLHMQTTSIVATIFNTTQEPIGQFVGAGISMAGATAMNAKRIAGMITGAPQSAYRGFQSAKSSYEKVKEGTTKWFQK